MPTLIIHWLVATWAAIVPWWPALAALAVAIITTVLVLEWADSKKKGE